MGGSYETTGVTVPLSIPRMYEGLCDVNVFICQLHRPSTQYIRVIASQPSLYYFCYFFPSFPSFYFVVYVV